MLVSSLCCSVGDGDVIFTVLLLLLVLLLVLLLLFVEIVRTVFFLLYLL